MKTYIIQGNPIPLARPRFNGKYVYDCQKKEKAAIASVLRLMHGALPMYEGPLLMTIRFFMRIPKSGKVGPLWHSKRPDLDNMIKLYSDVAIGIIYEDDNQISAIDAAKIYGYDPRTEITITELTKKG